jgi:hypothetical protein
LEECLYKAKGSLDSGKLNYARDYAIQAIQFDHKNQTSKLMNRLSTSYTVSDVPLLRATLNNNKLSYYFQLKDMNEVIKLVYGQLFYDINKALI